MDDLTLEIFMAVVVLGIVLRLRWQGNPRPAWFVAAGGTLMSIAGMIRHIELSDILIPLIIALISALIAVAAHRVRPKAQVE